MADPTMQPTFESTSRLHGKLAELFHKYADSGDNKDYQRQLEAEIATVENQLIEARGKAEPWLNADVPTPGEPEPEVPTEPTPDPNTDPQPDPEQSYASKFYVNANSEAGHAYQRALRENRTEDARRLRKLAERSNTVWFNGGDVGPIRFALQQAAQQDRDLCLVTYHVPGRDNGGHSRGGDADFDAFKRSEDELHKVIREEWPAAKLAQLVVIIEPDAVNLPDYLDDTRKKCLRYAAQGIDKLHVESSGKVDGYIDVGHSNWRPASEVAQRIKSLGLPQSTNLVSNVSSFQPTADEDRYCAQIANETGGRRWIIDTARNGLDQKQGEWCNPGNVIAGTTTTRETGLQFCDAFIWVKPPGESDGECNGGPKAGDWFERWALDFVERSEKAGRL